MAEYRSKFDVSVVIALNKIDSYTFEAVDSILVQQDVDYELVLVANGAKAESICTALLEYVGRAENIQFLMTAVPQLAYALNFGIDSARADIVARMDADDRSAPDRLKKQLYLMKQRGLDLIGSDVNLVDKAGQLIGERIYPKTPEEIQSKIYWGSPFCHPSVMFTKNLFYKARGYNSGLSSEDVDFWLRIRHLNPNWENHSDKLLEYRIHRGASQGSVLSYCEVAGHQLRELLLRPSLKGTLSVCVSVAKTLYVKIVN